MQKIELQSKTWRKVKLGDVISVFGGGTPSTQNPEYWNGNIPWLTPTEISGFSRRFIDRTERNISAAGLKNSSAKLMPADSILLTSRATIGDVVINKVPMATNQGFINILLGKEIDRQFLFYWLKKNRGYFNQIAVGSTFLELIKSVFREIDIKLPDLNDQKRIAEILSAFDDKIELNNKISAVLEQMAQAIFKEWFVKFRFPGYKKVKMVDSELGKIPEGWGVKKFSEIAHLGRGVSYSSKEISAKEGGLPMISLSNFLRGGGFNPNGVKHYTGEYKDSHLVKPGQIIIAMTDLTSNREVIGHPARVPEDFSKALISLDVCSINAEDIYVEFLYSFMLRRSFSQLMAGSASGTNVSHLNKTSIEEYLLIVPNRDLLPKFNELIRPMFTQQINLSAENQKLAALRDFLLPKLMNGEVKL